MLARLRGADKPSRMQAQMRRWVTWVGVVVLSAAGVAVGATLSRAAMSRGGRAPADPVLEAAASEEVAAWQGRRSLTTLTDRAYARARPNCPRVLDPGNPDHEGCIRDWLRLRDLIAAKLPAPEIPPAADQAGLATEGPAADMRGWLGTLTQDQRAGLRDIIGARQYDGIATSAASGDDEATRSAMRGLKAETEQLTDERPFEALRRYSQLKSLLGDKLDGLVSLAEKYK